MSDKDTGGLCPTTEQTSNAREGEGGCNAPSPSKEAEAFRASRIAALNDRLRKEGCGGMVHMTNGIAAMGVAKVNSLFSAIAAFADFTGDNDPYGEHDCAVMEIEGERIIWKIDYYDRTRTYHSPDPADPKVTVRVMTVMLASEY